MRMNKNKKTALVPKLRFPEFEDEGKWEKLKLSELLFETKQRNRDLKYDRQKVLSVSGEYGCVNQIEFMGRSYAGVSVKDYHVVEKGDIVYTKSPLKRNPFGIIKENKGNSGIVSTLYAVYRVTSKGCSSYLDQYFSGDYNLNSYLQPIVRKGAKNDMKVNNLVVLSGEIFAPKYPEQQKIADCLSSLDDLITIEGKKLITLKAHKKGLIQKLLPAAGEAVPEWRFPEFIKAARWRTISLIDTVDKNVKWSFTGGPFGSNLKSSDYKNDGIRVIQLQNIGDAEFVNNSKIFTSIEKADELLSCNIYPNEIIMSKMGDPVGRACIIPNFYARYLMCSDGIRLLIDKKNHSNYFIYSIINSGCFRSIIESHSTGSTRKRIGLEVLKNLQMVVPIKKEQQKIADCLSSLDDLVASQAEKTETLKLHKKSLMQGLFPSIEEV